MRYPEGYWYPVLESKSLGKEPIRIKRFSQDLVLFRGEDAQPICLSDQCAHRGASLSLGKVSGNCIQCPMHGLRYDAEGKCVGIPTSGKEAAIPPGLRVKRYPMHDAHDLIWMWWGPEEEIVPLPWWEDLETAQPFLAKSSWERSPVSFYRTMEANLDLIHFPFVHPNPSWMQRLANRFPQRFGFLDVGLRLDPFHCDVVDDVIHMRWEFRREGAAPAQDDLLELWVRFPNQLMVNVPRWNARGYFGCVPIDDESTWFAAWYGQGFVNVPYLGDLVAWLFLNKLVLGPITQQDLRVQTTQRPKEMGLGSDRLVHGDRGIAEYWRLLQKAWARADARGESTVTPFRKAG